VSYNLRARSCNDPLRRSEQERPQSHARRAQAQRRTVWSRVEAAVRDPTQQRMKRNDGSFTPGDTSFFPFHPVATTLLSLHVTCCCARVLPMASADEPSADELRDIARGICALVSVTLEDPVDAEQLRQLVDDPALPDWVRFALNACADALAEHESPAEIRELREAAKAYDRWRTRGAALRERLLKAICKAEPLLDAEAAARAQARDEAQAALTAEQRADGFVVQLWPSPESLRAFTREVSAVLSREDYAVPWLLKVVEDLTRFDADHRIVTMLGPVKTRVAKILAEGGHGVPAIATVVEPYAKPGRERKQACNTVNGRLKSASDDWLFSVRVDPSAPNASALTAELEESARFVAGVGRNVLILVGPPPRRENEPD